MWTSIQAVTSYELRLRKQVVHKIESMDITVVRRERNGQGMLTQDLRWTWVGSEAVRRSYICVFVYTHE